MRKVVLKDGTVLPKCSDSTTVDTVCVYGDTYAEAGAQLDLVTPENAQVIRVYDEEDNLLSSGGHLTLLPGITVTPIYEGGVTLNFSVRRQTEMEALTERVSDLEDVIVGE